MPMKNEMGEMWAFIFYACVLVAGVLYGIFMMKEPEPRPIALRESLISRDEQEVKGSEGLLDVSSVASSEF
jgi:hypothetical protein